MRRCFNYRTIRQLMLFAAVTQEKSFRRAAKRLNMSVPPLVLQIDELEARLKMKLLERTPRGVSPTAQGNAIMPMIDQLVRQAEILDYSVKQMSAKCAGNSDDRRQYGVNAFLYSGVQKNALRHCIRTFRFL